MMKNDRKSLFSGLGNQIITCVLCFFFGVLNADNYKYDLAIGAIFRDEAPYLKEWIEFHKLVGVQHFYLFNNLSEDEYADVLAPYLAKGEVELIEWPYHAELLEKWVSVQGNAYSRCVHLAQNDKVKWLALIDIDEFLTPMFEDNVLEVLKDYEEFGGVGFNWKLFGHSGLMDLPENKLLIESLVMAAPQERPTHLGVKSIVRPQRVQGCHHAHYVIYKKGFYHVNSNKKRCIDQQGVTNHVYYDRLVINHYWSRTGNYLYKKLLRWNAYASDLVPEKWLEYVSDMNIVRDHSMERFVTPLHEKMGF